MANTFMKAQGKEIGLSLLEEDKIDFAKDLLENNADQIVLPVDCKVAKEFSNDAKITEVSIDEIPSDQEAMDIGPKTVELFNKEDYLLLRIQDNGKGFNVDEKFEQSYGLKNMRERALEIGATFHIVSLPDSGTRIEVKAPLNKEDESNGD